jgi:hypothetical protein
MKLDFYCAGNVGNLHWISVLINRSTWEIDYISSAYGRAEGKDDHSGSIYSRF